MFLSLELWRTKSRSFSSRPPSRQPEGTILCSVCLVFCWKWKQRPFFVYHKYRGCFLIHLMSVSKWHLCFFTPDLPPGPESPLEGRSVFPQNRGVSPPGPERQRGHAVPQNDPWLHLLIHRRRNSVSTPAHSWLVGMLIDLLLYRPIEG